MFSILFQTTEYVNATRSHFKKRGTQFSNCCGFEAATVDETNTRTSYNICSFFPEGLSFSERIFAGAVSKQSMKPRLLVKTKKSCGTHTNLQERNYCGLVKRALSAQRQSRICQAPPQSGSRHTAHGVVFELEHTTTITITISVDTEDT
jgi:hypothetical protein